MIPYGLRKLGLMGFFWNLSWPVTTFATHCACVWKLEQVKQVYSMVSNLHRFTAGPALSLCHGGCNKWRPMCSEHVILVLVAKLWRVKSNFGGRKSETTTSLVVSLHLSSPKNEKAAFFGLQRLEPSTHKLMASHAARRCATKPRKRLRIRLRTSCVCET